MTRGWGARQQARPATPDTGSPAAHRKACLVLRQTLDPDAVYADAATHGDGLTSLQWRDTKGGATHEVQSDIVGPRRLRIEKRGNYVSMSIAAPGEELHPAGGSARVEFTGDFYLGLGVSSHETGRIDTVAFSDVTVSTPPTVPAGARMTVVNTLETINVRSGAVAGQPVCRVRELSTHSAVKGSSIMHD